MEYEGERWALSLGWERGVLGAGIEAEHDRLFGSVSVTGLLLGLRIRASYTYDLDTPLRRDLRERMDELRSQCFVSVRVDEYDALKADADKWRNVPVESLGRGLDARLADSPPSPDAWFREKAP